MADFNTLLSQTLNAMGVPQSAPGVTEQKSMAAPAVAAAKQSALSGVPTPDDFYRIGAANLTGKGIRSGVGIEHDLENLSTQQLFYKYGPDMGAQLIAQRARGAQAFGVDARASRTAGQDLRDSVLGVGGSLASTFGSIGALAGGVSDKTGLTYGAGAAATGLVNDINNTVASTESEALGQVKKVAATKQGLDERDHQLDRTASVKDGDSAFLAGLAKIGKDALSSTGNYGGNADLVGDLAANAGGSILAFGPMAESFGLLGKGLQTAGRAVVPEMIEGQMLGATPARFLLESAKGAVPTAAKEFLAENGSGMAANALMEGSGAYQQAVTEAQDKGATPEQANDAGLLTAAIHGPLAAGITAGLDLNAFEKTPFRVPHTLGEAAAPLKEAVDEGLQGASQQLAQNAIMRATGVDPNQDLTEGVGDQVAQGAIGGIASAAGMEGPGLALKVGVGAPLKAIDMTIEGAKKAFQGMVAGQKAALDQSQETAATTQQVDAANSAYDLEAELKKIQDNQAASYAAAGIDPAAEQAKQEAFDQQQAAIGKLLGMAHFDLSHVEDAPFAVQLATAGARDKFAAMRQAAAAVEHAPTAAEKAQLGAWLQRSWGEEQSKAIAQLHQVAKGDIPEDTPEQKATLAKLERFVDTFHALKDHPLIQKGLEAAHQAVQDTAGIETALADPIRGQPTADAVVQLATDAPEKINPAVVDTLRRHAKDGTIRLTPEQLAVLQSAAALVQAHQQLADGEQVKTDKTAGEVIGAGGKVGFGAQEHVRSVAQAVQSGDTGLAEKLMTNFGLFAQHMSRKVDALNTSAETGKPAPYSALKSMYDRTMGVDDRGAGKQSLHLHDEGSIKYAQRVAREAQAVAELHNQMIKAYPKIENQTEITPSKLAIDPNLEQKPSSLVRAKGELTVSEPSAPAEVKPTAEETPPVPVAEPVAEAKPKEAEPAANPAPPETSDSTAPSAETAQEADQSEQAPKLLESSKTPPRLKDLYPELTGAKEKLNWFLKALSFGSKGSGSRLTGTLNPINFVQEALASVEAFVKALNGGKLDHKLSDTLLGDWAHFVEETGADLHEALAQRLQAFLKAESKTTGFKTVGGNLAHGEQMLNPVTNWLQGRVTNLTQPDGHNGFEYNPELLQSAMLAGLQWLVSTTSRPQQFLDEERIGKTILHVDPMYVSDEAKTFFNNGLWDSLAVRQLADAIERFWGVRGNDQAPIGFSRGISEAMAGEILDAMVDDGLLAKGTGKFNGKDYIQLGLVAEQDGGIPDATLKALHAFPDLLEYLAVKEPEVTRHIGTPPAKIADTQQRNSLVANSPEQKGILERKQNTVHRINEPGVKFYETIGSKLTLQLFGAGELEGRKLNRNTRASLEGQNTTVGGAFQELTGLMAELRNKAQAAKISPAQMPIYYAFNFARNGRLMMQGAYNPQASKLLRELILPTWSTLDLSDAGHKNAFRLALAQALGVKVHKMPMDKALDQLDLKLKTLSPALELLKGFAKTGQFTEAQVGQLQLAFAAAEVELTPVALHALMEQGRSDSLKPNEPFETGLYLEADGVTDGPINALWHLATGEFNGRWVELMAKGGAFFGSTKVSLGDYIASATQNNIEPGKDLYQATADDTIIGANNILKFFKTEHPGIYPQAKLVMTLLDRTLGKDLSFDPQSGKLTIMDRGIAKNPLTVTVYGSGSKGIASKITDTVMEAFYAQLSDAMEGKGDPKAVADLQRVIETLANQKIVIPRNPEKKGFLSNRTLNPKTGKYDKPLISPEAQRELQGMTDKTYTLTREHLNVLRDNIEAVFVSAMQEAVENTMKDTRYGRELLMKSIQVQSIWLEHKFRELVAEKLAEKRAANPTSTLEGPKFTNEQFLSQAELDEITAQLSKFSPLVKLAGLSIYMGDSNASDIASLGVNRPILGFGASTTGGMKAAPQIDGPSNAGVRGIPFTVIGFGDALMVQLLNLMQDSPQGTLDVFDGIHLKLDTLFEDAAKVNQAVHQAWGYNPLGAVNDVFQQFLKDSNLQAELNATLLSDEERTAQGLTTLSPELEKALREVLERGPDAGPAEEELKWLTDGFQQAALEAQARHNVLAKVQMSIDHMASASSPYLQLDGLDLAGLDSSQVASKLNELYRTELAALGGKVRSAPVAEAPAKPVKTFDSAKAKAGLAKITKLDALLGGKVISRLDFAKLPNLLNLIPEQKNLLREAIRTLGPGWEIIHGSEEVLQNYGAIAEGSRGWMDGDAKRIALVDPSVETMVHEVIHASITDKLLGYYNDPASVTPEVAEAIQNLERLMAQWMVREDMTAYGATSVAHFKASLAYADALRQIEEELANPRRTQAANRAAALDEFIAWNLSNKQLIALGQNTKVENPLARVAKKALVALKNLIWGRNNGPMIRSDMYSALRYHTSLVMNGPTPVLVLAQDLVRMHNPSWGTSDRLTNAEQAWNQKIGVHLDEQPNLAAKTLEADVIKAQTIGLGDRVAESFAAHGWPMTPQENHLFSLITTSFGVLNKLNPVALNQAQTLFDHVMKTLQREPSRLYDPSIPDPQAQHYYADQKLNSLLGTYMQVDDRKGRSSLLPAFMALATVSDEFREVLKGLPLPKGETFASGKSVDEKLTNGTEQLLNQLATHLSGQGAGQANVKGAIDALTRTLADATEQKKALLNQIQGPLDDPAGLVSQGIETANEKVRGVLQAGSAKLIKGLDAAQAQTKEGGAVHTALEYTKMLAAAINDTEGPAAAEGLIRLSNTLKLWDPVHRIIGDLIGRTESNSPVTDLIKQLRTFVQQVRQQFRDHLPVKLASEFSRPLTVAEKAHMNAALGKTDAMALKGYLSLDQILDLFLHPARVGAEAAKLEDLIKAELNSPRDWKALQAKARQLATQMMTGNSGYHLLRNAEAVATGFRGQNQQPYAPSQALIANVDRLVTLYAMGKINVETRIAMGHLAQTERAGLTFLSHYLVGQRKDEMAKVQGMARMNYYKGHLPAEPQRGVQLVVRPISEHARMLQLGFTKVGNYQNSLHETLGSPNTREQRAYYFAPVGKAPFEQGAMQNAHTTAYGVDPHTGFSYGPMTAGRIVGPKAVHQLSLTNLGNSAPEGTQLQPIFDDEMNIVAYERSVDPLMVQKLNHETDLLKNVGVWRGRQAEEGLAREYNQQLIAALHKVWVDGRADNRSGEFIDVLDTKLMETDPVIYDAVQLFSPDTIEMIKEIFGSRVLMVRKDLVDDTIGYRKASVGDAWTGVTRWSPEVSTAVKAFATQIWGDDAYRILVTGERVLQRAVSEVKQNIIIRSVVVPLANTVSNVYQLMSMGVSPLTIGKLGAQKVSETHAYLARRLRQDDIEAELRASEGDVVKTRNLQRELKGLTDANKRMSIWPLIEAGEFSSIHDVGADDKGDLTLFEGKLHAYISNLVDQLPPGLQTASKYVLVSKETALFKGLERALAYGDFVAKAIAYDHLTQLKAKKVSHEDALHRIGEAFVNYDRLAGRWRSYAESIGGLWFWNYKIRITKEAIRIMRENPLQALLTSFVPAPEFLGIGSPMSDNLPVQILNGKAWNSVGPGMGLRNLVANPWQNALGGLA